MTAVTVPILHPTDPEAETLLTPQDLAERWQVTVSFIYHATNRGCKTRGGKVLKLPHIKVGKYTRFRDADVNLFLEQQRRGK